MKQNRVLIILGMHRSGTSLTAGWLKYCGLNVGDKLLQADSSNPEGHYEDLDFLNLHKEILEENDTDYLNVSDKKLTCNDYFRAKAEAIVMFKNKLHSQWGWKEPRTCLLLDLYRKLIPEAVYLVIYRPYPEVIDSLLRRAYSASLDRLTVPSTYLYQFKFAKKIDTLANEHLKSWCVYNKRILEHLKVIKEPNYLSVSLKHLVSNSGQVLEWLIDQHHFDLATQSIDAIYSVAPKKKPQKFVLQPEIETEGKKIWSELKKQIKIKI